MAWKCNNFNFVSLLLYCGFHITLSKKTTLSPSFSGPDTGFDTLSGLLGPVGLSPYTGSGVSATSASDLNCDFSLPCCWSNVGPPKDNLEWVQGTTIPDAQRFQNLFGTSQLPQTPYLITSSAAGASTSYAILNSCAMQCQSGTGTLTLNKWTSPQVNLDACVLPIGSTEFTYCQTITDPGPQATVQIPPQSGPFQLVIAASNFVLSPGGAAIIDDLNYQGTVGGNCPNSTASTPINIAVVPTVTPSPIVAPISPAICSAIACNFANGLCAYNGAGGTCPFIARSGKTGCWAGGVPNGPGGGPYAGAELGPTAKATLQSATFTTDQPLRVRFKFYDGPMGVTTKGCVDNEGNCPFVSVSQSLASDRQWKEGTIDVPSGTHSIYFTSTNQGGEYAGVGIADVNVASYGGQPTSC